MKISDKLKNILKICLIKDVNKRGSAKDVLMIIDNIMRDDWWVNN